MSDSLFVWFLLGTATMLMGSVAAVFVVAS